MKLPPALSSRGVHACAAAPESRSLSAPWVLMGVTAIHLAMLAALAGRAGSPAHRPQLPALTVLLLSASPDVASSPEPVVARPKRWSALPQLHQEVQPTVSSSTDAAEPNPTPPEPVATVAAQRVHSEELAIPAPTAAVPTQAPLEAVVPPRTDASQLNHPAVYPPASRRLNEQGVVQLEVFVLSDGSVGEVRLKQSSGYSRLDDAALDAVRRWRYLPARRGGQPIAAWYLQPVTFSLAA